MSLECCLKIMESFGIQCVMKDHPVVYATYAFPFFSNLTTLYRINSFQHS